MRKKVNQHFFNLKMRSPLVKKRYIAGNSRLFSRYLQLCSSFSPLLHLTQSLLYADFCLGTKSRAVPDGSISVPLLLG